jgi:hypothetical protein
VHPLQFQTSCALTHSTRSRTFVVLPCIEHHYSSGIALAVGLLVKLQYPLKAGKDIDVSLSTHGTVPHLLTQPNLDQ